MSYHSTPPRRSAARTTSRPRSLYSSSPSPQSRNLSSYSTGLSSSTPYLNSSYNNSSYNNGGSSYPGSSFSSYGGTSSGYGGLTLPSSYSRPSSQSSPRSYHSPSSFRSYVPPSTSQPLPPVRPRRSKSSSRASNYTPAGEGVGGRMSRSGSTTSLNSLKSEAASEGYEVSETLCDAIGYCEQSTQKKK